MAVVAVAAVVAMHRTATGCMNIVTMSDSITVRRVVTIQLAKVSTRHHAPLHHRAKPAMPMVITMDEETSESKRIANNPKQFLVNPLQAQMNTGIATGIIVRDDNFA